MHAYTPTVQRHLAIQKQHCAKVKSETLCSDIFIQREEPGRRFLLQGTHQRRFKRVHVCARAWDPGARVSEQITTGGLRIRHEESLWLGTTNPNGVNVSESADTDAAHSSHICLTLCFNYHSPVDQPRRQTQKQPLILCQEVKPEGETRNFRQREGTNWPLTLLHRSPFWLHSLESLNS